MDREDFSAEGCVVVARGQIDLYSAPTFKTALVNAIESGKTEIVVDLTGVDFMDSTGLGVLVGAGKRLRPDGGSIAIVTNDDTIRRVFEISGLTGRFNMFADRKEAVKHASARSN